MGAPVMHFEIHSADYEGEAKFYGELFGWTTTEAMPNYLLVDTFAGEGIGGGIGQTDEGSYTIFYVEVPDPQASLDKAEKLGGKILTPVTEIPDIVTFAILSDIAGNKIGLVKAGGEGPGVSAGKNPPLAWFEVLGPDGEALHKFYSALFGWKIKAGDVGGFVYGEVDTGTERGIPGGIGASRDGSPVVSLYAKVDNIEKTLETAEKLGAKTALEPLDVGTGTTVAAFIDPQSNLFGIFKTSS